MSNTLEVRITSQPQAVIYPTQIVAGIVELNIQKAVKARNLRLIVKGKAECSWHKKEQKCSQTNETYTGKQQYLESITYLFGSDHGEPADVPLGLHTYNFQCQLPPDIPYSLEGKRGKIRYKVEANLDIPWALDLTSKKPFTVARHDDWSQHQSLVYRSPCEVDLQKIFCWWLCASQPLIIVMRVPRRAYGLGETIPIQVEMTNRSSRNVSSSLISLKQIEQFNSTDPPGKSISFKTLVASKPSRGVRPGETVIIDEQLAIPSDLKTSNDHVCTVFQIKYFLRIKAITGFTSRSPKLDMAVTIGNVGVGASPSDQYKKNPY